MFYSSIGIVFTNLSLFRTQKRFTLHHFKNLGFGKKYHEDVIHEETRHIIHDFSLAKNPLITEVVITII